MEEPSPPPADEDRKSAVVFADYFSSTGTDSQGRRQSFPEPVKELIIPKEVRSKSSVETETSSGSIKIKDNSTLASASSAQPTSYEHLYDGDVFDPRYRNAAQFGKVSISAYDTGKPRRNILRARIAQ